MLDKQIGIGMRASLLPTTPSPLPPPPPYTRATLSFASYLNATQHMKNATSDSRGPCILPVSRSVYQIQLA